MTIIGLIVSESFESNTCTTLYIHSLVKYYALYVLSELINYAFTSIEQSMQESNITEMNL